jgi:FtsZ-interacting cell division protein ZipA
MYEAPVMEQRRTVPVNNVNNTYSSRVSNGNRQVPNYTPYRSSHNVQNDVYMRPMSSDNVKPVNPYENQQVQQNAQVYRQAQSYNQAQSYQQPTYRSMYTAPVVSQQQYQQQAYTNNNYQQQYAGYQTKANYYNQQSYVNSSALTYQQPAVKQSEYEVVAPEKTAKKPKNKMTKMLIAVYFFIIAVCATLIIINIVAAAGNTTVSASTENEAITYVSGETYYSVAQDGTVAELQNIGLVDTYQYDTTTNWFDTLCDKIGKIFG